MAEQERALYNVFQGKQGRTQGVYLDELERRQLEDYRARIENREPDYTNLDIGYAQIVPESMVPDNHVMSNPSAARDPQHVEPVVVTVHEVFDEPSVVVRGGTNYVDNLNSVNAAAAAAAPAGAPAGAYDDGGKGGPGFLQDAFHTEDQEKRQKKLDEVGKKAAQSVKTKTPEGDATTSPTMAPENQPPKGRKVAAKKATPAKKSTPSRRK